MGVGRMGAGWVGIGWEGVGRVGAGRMGAGLTPGLGVNEVSVGCGFSSFGQWYGTLREWLNTIK